MAKKVTKKVSVRAASSKLPSIGKKMTKAEIIAALAKDTQLSRKQVDELLHALANLMSRHIQKRGSGEFTIPNTGIKVCRVRRPARKARMGRNPATGEPMKIAAKPVSLGIRITALKALKDVLSR